MTSLRLSEDEIRRAIDNCPRLGSLRSINSALAQLVNAEQSFTSQIAEIIRRDPSLTSRLLKLVNSVFFGLAQRVTNIEDAIFYLGLRQIRELALATPVIEDFQHLTRSSQRVDWRLLWQHSIGTAILTRDIMALANISFQDDSDYIVGLVHNVGKIVMAFAFPDQFKEIVSGKAPTADGMCALENDILGWDHAKIGAYFLRRHQLSAEIVEAVEFHHRPRNAQSARGVAAAVQVAEHMVRSVGVPGIERVPPPAEGSWVNLQGWRVLFGNDPGDWVMPSASLRPSVNRLPFILRGMV